MTIRFGVIGTNWISERFIKAGRLIDGFSVEAVYSRTETGGAQFANKHNIKLTFTNLEEMAKCPHIDAVYIASPNSLHMEQAIICMNEGKHVLCEKPLASNVKEVRKLIAVAQSQKVVLMEALKSTLLPNFKAVQKNLYKIGKVRRYIGNYCSYSSRYDSFLNGTILNAFNPQLSNGSIMDIGIYCLYPMVVLFGKPNRVQANALKLHNGFDGQGSMIMNFDDHEAIVMYSKISQSNVPSEIQGEKGSIIIDNINTPSRVEIQYIDGKKENITQEQNNEVMFYEIREFMDLIKNGRLQSEINSHNNSLIVAEIIEEARKQAQIIFPADQ